MDKKLEHTPTPYRTVIVGGVQVIKAHPADRRIATMAHSDDVNPEREGNAAFFVRACNNHDALVRRLTLLVEAIDDENEHDHDIDECDVCYAVDDAKWQLKRLEKQGGRGANDLLLEAVGLIGTMLENTVDGLEAAREIMTPAQCTVLESYTVDFKEWLDKAKGGA